METNYQPPSPLILLNCRNCDDVLKLVDSDRLCECGRSCGRLERETPRISGPVRLFAIDWEQYDGLALGVPRTFRAIRNDAGG